MKQRVRRRTSDELERSATVGCAGLGSTVKTAGFEVCAFPLLLVGVVGIVPWFCKAWDKLCNFARSNCAEDMSRVDAETGAGAGLWEIEFVVRCGFSAPSVRDNIEDKAVEEDKVARALVIFNGAFDVGVWFELSL